ncbi:DUF4226 domain-containing protein [Mycobacterium decipiens]|uniref:DUF4226 domain-containing protein n=1 Tax=Mycobacterium decipiens TaxID=1430326 RepID=A0A1X2LTT5_9MYCO|nr:DUF4226 domain-containing protein [Mycobacterium decipiens]OSC40284.1 hypothetical protein B8W66_13275 [Mycobacterium decipiens]
MSTLTDLLAAVEAVRDATGDPNEWQTGLTPTEVAAVLTPTTRSEQLDAILAKIRQHHPTVFNPATATLPTHPGKQEVPGAPTDRQHGDAAEAIAAAEAALAHQNSASAQLDMQVISAILNAHRNAVEGGETLNRLQQETEAAVRTRSDLDTPAGARDFQRFLIGKLRDIRAVVATASLDDTSKAALMAAWTALYGAAKTGPNGADERPRASVAPDPAPVRGDTQFPTLCPDAGWDPSLDSLLFDDPGPLAGDLPPQGPTSPAMPMMPAMPSIPNIGAGPVPSSAMGSMPGGPGGFPLSGLLRGTGIEPGGPDDGRLESTDPNPQDHASDDEPDERTGDAQKDAASENPESPPAGPTTVTLPNGDTVTAASPQLAAAIKAAAGGAPIADAFQRQGITIPPPGTAVANPIDPSQVVPGDIGMLTDRHALALGRSKALLDGQIQHISTVSGPSFLGWEHPPTSATATAPARTETPTPTRPAATSTGLN